MAQGCRGHGPRLPGSWPKAAGSWPSAVKRNVVLTLSRQLKTSESSSIFFPKAFISVSERSFFMRSVHTGLSSKTKGYGNSRSPPDSAATNKTDPKPHPRIGQKRFVRAGDLLLHMCGRCEVFGGYATRHVFGLLLSNMCLWTYAKAMSN